MKIQNKTWVVTGGGSGIGRALVLEILRRGGRAAAVDMHPLSLEETRILAGNMASRLSLHELNITHKPGVAALPEQVMAVHGSVDGLINNAGIIQPFVKVAELDDAAIQRVMDVNFFGTLGMTRAFLPQLMQRPEAHILNISSMGGFLPVPGQAIYGAAKAAVKLFTEALFAELQNTKVRVTVAFPGAIATNITTNSGVKAPGGPAAEKASKDFKPLPAEKAANILLDAIESNQFRVLVGSDAGFMDKLYRFSPAYATRFIAKKMASLLG